MTYVWCIFLTTTLLTLYWSDGSFLFPVDESWSIGDAFIPERIVFAQWSYRAGICMRLLSCKVFEEFFMRSQVCEFVDLLLVSAVFLLVEVFDEIHVRYPWISWNAFPSLQRSHKSLQRSCKCVCVEASLLCAFRRGTMLHATNGTWLEMRMCFKSRAHATMENVPTTIDEPIIMIFLTWILLALIENNLINFKLISSI